jgi:hypothetical protein
MILKPNLFRKLHFGPHWSKTNLVSLWLMNEGTGNNTIFDLSGNDSTGTFEGTAPSWTVGKYGSAVLLPGTDEYIDLGDIRLIPQTDDFSIGVLFNYSSTDTDGIILFAQYISATGNGRIHFNVGNDGSNDKLRVFLGDDNSEPSITLTTTSNLSSNTWYYGFLTRKGLVFSLYLDGVFENSRTDGTVRDILQAGNIIGARSSSGAYNNDLARFFDGILDNISVYHRALSTSEIALLSRNPFIMFDRDEIDLWAAATQGVVAVGNAGIMTTNTGFWGATF